MTKSVMGYWPRRIVRPTSKQKVRPIVDRAEHLAFCKERALEYVEQGDLHQAFASMTSDMNKHPETANSGVEMLGMGLLMGGHLDTKEEMRDWINGFN